MFLHDVRLCHEARQTHNLLGSTSPFRFFSLALIVLFPTSMETNKLHAILTSKSAIPIMALSSTNRCLDLEVEGDVEFGQKGTRDQYSVKVSVADTVVAKSPRSSVLKWEWTANNQMWVLV
jgi:hypothetical protein